MKRYDIFVGTEQSTPTNAELLRAVYSHVDGATILHGHGVWEGELERALLITIMAPAEKHASVIGLCTYLRDLCRQDCVMLTVCELESMATF
jgi:hypothetical protein